MSRLPIDPFPEPDYIDCFELAPPAPIPSLDEFVTDLVLRQPAWLTTVSMGLGRRNRRKRALADLRAGRTTAIGKWAVLERGDHHIAFGEDMRIMRYRLTFRLDADEMVMATTEVEQTSRWSGRTYWSLVEPLHRRFLAILLRNAGGPGSRVRERTDEFRSNRAALG